MYDYISVRLDCSPCNETITDLLAAFLADIEFESFEPDEKGLTAYVRKDKYDPESLKEVLQAFPIDTKIEPKEELIKGEDWNKEWEQNYFSPIMIDDRLLIRSSFHKEYPKTEMEIIIDPKMAFGTGHHSTTAGMSKMLLKSDLEGKSVIDMGTGTGILAILAKKLGADKVTGIDIDKFAVENARENGEANGVEIGWKEGTTEQLDQLEEADIFLANINLNVILDNLKKYVSKLKKGGRIYLSGFLDTDEPAIMNVAEKLGLRFVDKLEDKKWLAMEFEK